MRPPDTESKSAFKALSPDSLEAASALIPADTADPLTGFPELAEFSEST